MYKVLLAFCSKLIEVMDHLYVGKVPDGDDTIL